MDNDTRIPGVTFHLDKATLGPSVEHKSQGKVMLLADVDDFDMWEEALKHLGSLRIYSTDDFKSELVEMLQEDVKSRDKIIAQLRIDMNEQTQRLRLENDILRGKDVHAQFELRKKEAQISVLEEELRGLRAMAAELQELSAISAG